MACIVFCLHSCVRHTYSNQSADYSAIYDFGDHDLIVVAQTASNARVSFDSNKLNSVFRAHPRLMWGGVGHVWVVAFGRVGSLFKTSYTIVFA